MNFAFLYKCNLLYWFKGHYYWALGASDKVMRMPNARCKLRLGLSHSDAWIIHTQDVDLEVHIVQDSSLRERRGMLLPEDRAPVDDFADEDEEMVAEEEEEEEEEDSQAYGIGSSAFGGVPDYDYTPWEHASALQWGTGSNSPLSSHPDRKSVV